jgi:methoxymalonate biosynthesis acyl carrier protein
VISQEATVLETLRAFILSSVSVADLDDDDDLFETGIVNSLFAIQLMTFVEKTFDIDVTMDDLDIENFRSIRASANFVIKKKGHSA